jgi:hypothetical protein
MTPWPTNYHEITDEPMGDPEERVCEHGISVDVECAACNALVEQIVQGDVA